MRNFRAAPDVLIAEIAGRQHGVIRTDQLTLAGLTKQQITRRVAVGHLHRLYRGIYAVGHTDLSQKGKWIAAVFACGPDAVLSHESAAQLWSLTPTSPPHIHVTIPNRGSRARRKGIVLHRSRTLTDRDVTSRHNIPVTKPARTRRDLGWDSAPTRSSLERRFLKLIRDAGLPAPEVNVRVGPYLVDFLWRNERLIVELDSYAYHSSRESFVSDRRRDRELKGRGLEVHRYTDQELDDAPDAICASLSGFLG